MAFENSISTNAAPTGVIFLSCAFSTQMLKKSAEIPKQGETPKQKHPKQINPTGLKTGFRVYKVSA